MKGLYYFYSPVETVKLYFSGYLRMAVKVLTAIGKVIEGKTISVTICHECHEVRNHYFCSIAM